jgi:hypothetical protein
MIGVAYDVLQAYALSDGGYAITEDCLAKIFREMYLCRSILPHQDFQISK